MITTKKEFYSDPSTLYLVRSRIETLKRMADRYGRITVHDVQLIFGKLDGDWTTLDAVSHGWDNTRFFIPVWLKDGWYVVMPDPKKF